MGDRFLLLWMGQASTNGIKRSPIYVPENQASEVKMFRNFLNDEDGTTAVELAVSILALTAILTLIAFGLLVGIILFKMAFETL